MNVEGKRVVVVGLGRSGIAACRLLRERGAHVTATDAVPRERLAEDAIALEASGVVLSVGGQAPEPFHAADFVVVSPGVPSFPLLDEVEASGREVIGELELASRFLDAPIVLVGGTNGKSTTTALVGSIFEHAYGPSRRVFVGGNFGRPLAEAVGGRHGLLVVEISSFQSERVPTLHASGYALLNITEDHLDRYPSFEAYADAKGNPFERMTPEDVAVVPAGDRLVSAQAERGRARIVTFSIGDPKAGAYRVGGDVTGGADVRVEGDDIVDGTTGARYPIRLLRLSGQHNVANACAAIALASARGVERGAIETALALFEGLGHRTVPVAEIGGVRYYDDSKGTNVGASVAALRGLVEPKAVLIAGGRDKQGSYEPLVDALRDRGRGLVVIGEAAERIASAAAGALPVVRADSMADAVRGARDLARPGDAVLLSPACSSFDMFRDYKDRGDAFVRAVQALTEEETLP